MDKSDCTTSCGIVSQVAVMIINVIFGVFGFVVIGIGASIKGVVNFNIPNVSGLDDYSLGIAGPFSSGADALIVLGVFMFLISILGCAAGCIQNKCLLLSYAIIIFIIFIYIIVVLSLVFGGALLDKTKTEMYDVLKKDYVGSLSLIQRGTQAIPGVTVTAPKQPNLKTLILDSIQLNYQCCGVDNVRDYTTDPQPAQWPRAITVDGVARTLNIPVTCCKPGDGAALKACISGPNDANSNMNTGCFKKIEEIYNGARGPDIAVLVIVLFLTLALLILSLYIYFTAEVDDTPTMRWQNNNNDNNKKPKKKVDQVQRSSMYIPNYQPRENQYDTNAYGSGYDGYNPQGYDNFYDGYGYSGQTFSQVPSVESGVYTPDWYSGERIQAPRVMTAGTFNPGFVTPYGGGLI